MQLGIAWQEAGKPGPAAEAYRQVIELLDGRAGDLSGEQRKVLASACCNRGTTLGLTGRWQDALALLHRAVDLTPDDWQAKHNLVCVLVTCPDANQRDTAEALRLAAAVARERPEDALVRGALGAAYIRTGDWKRGRAELFEAARLGMNQPEAIDVLFLAMANWHLGEKDWAKRDVEKVARWMDRTRSDDAMLRQVRAELEALVNTKEPPPAPKP